MALEIKNLSFFYNKKKILRDISLCLKKGEIGALIGASGSGKTTLFKLLTGLLPIQQGQISLFGQSLPGESQNIAYMMQQDVLLPWRTVLSNVLLPKELGPGSSVKPDDEEEALYLLEELGLGDCSGLYPDKLSGGMRQRVSLARALLLKRPLLLLDEPFGALDVVTREQMYRFLRRIKDKFTMTILMITHDFRDAISLSDHIFLLTRSRIEQDRQIDPSLRHNVAYIAQIQEEVRELLAASYADQEPVPGVFTKGVF